MLSLTPCARNPQVLCRSDQFFIHDSGLGHTFPATRQHVVGRFGEPFAAAVEQCPGVWVDFDPDIRADRTPEPATIPVLKPITVEVHKINPEAFRPLNAKGVTA